VNTAEGADPSRPLDLHALAEGITEEHRHLDVAHVNDHRVTLAVNEAPFPWHVHPESDELFLVLEGKLTLELADGTSVVLGPGQVCTVPAGTMHRTTPLGRCVNLIFERSATSTKFRKEDA